jgi:hypothetical protein
MGLHKTIPNTASGGLEEMPATATAEPVLRSDLELHALNTAPACARWHVRLVLQEWGLSELADTAELLTSELVTNATQASERLRSRADLAIVPVVRLWLISDRISVVIHVWDGSDDMPVRRDADPDEISGRGLMIIDTLSAKWGSYRKADGKVVWALISAEQP